MQERKCSASLLEFWSTIFVKFGTFSIHVDDKVFEAQIYGTVGHERWVFT
jgi:hypothetical protein